MKMQSKRKALTLWSFLPFAFLVPGLYLTWLCWKTVAQVEKRLDWIEVPAQLSQWKMEEEANSGNGIRRTLKGFNFSENYRYMFDGKAYESNSIDGAGFSRARCDYRVAIARRFKAGGEATCFVNPENPREAVLFNWFTPHSMPFFYVGFAYLALTVGVWIVFALVEARRNEARMAAQGFTQVNPAPGFAVLAATMVIEGIFFGWLLMRLYALPPETLYGGTLTWWLNLLPVPGALGAVWYAVKALIVWPRRRVTLTRPEAEGAAGYFLFCGKAGAFKDAVVSLEVLGLSPKKAWKTEIRDSLRVCDERTCRVDFAFTPPARFRKTTEYRMILKLNQIHGKTETYEWNLIGFISVP